MYDTASSVAGMSRTSPHPPAAAAASSTTAIDLSVIAHRDAYIDNNLTQIDNTTPKHFTYLHEQPDAAAVHDSAAFHRLQSRVSALEQENRRWVEEYQLACRQNASLQAHIQLMMHDRCSMQPPSPSASISLCSSSSSSSPADSSLPARPSSPASALSCPHPRDSLLHAVLLENGVLLDRYDSLQRRCRLQEHMIEHRNATLTELQRALIHNRETARRQRHLQQQQAAAAAAEARDSAQSSARPSQFHSRQSSSASNCSERSAEQLVDDIEALLTRQPRLCIATSPPAAPLSPSRSGKAEAEEMKQQDDAQRSGAGSFSARTTASTASSSAQRRAHRPTLTVSHSQSASRQLSPGLPPHPVHRSPHSAASPSSSPAVPAVAVKAKTSRVTPETESSRSKQRTRLSATTPLATSPRSPASPASPVPTGAAISRAESRGLD